MMFKLVDNYAIETPAECVINSANGLLMHDSSGAGRIRECSSECEELLFKNVFMKLPLDMQEFITIRSKEHNWKPRFANQTAAELVYKNKNPFSLGDAIYDELLSKDLGKHIIHAITLSYDTTTTPVKRILGNEESIYESYTKALRLAHNLECKSVAFPIPIAREGYGLNPEKSYIIIEDILEKHAKKDVTYYLCFDNTDTKKLLKKLQE